MHKATSQISTSDRSESGRAKITSTTTYDPVVALIAERRKLMAKLEDPAVDPKSDAKIMSRCAAIDRRLANTRATTPAGGIAALEQVRWEMETFHLDGAPPHVSRLCMGLLDSVAGVLKAAH